MFRSYDQSDYDEFAFNGPPIACGSDELDIYVNRELPDLLSNAAAAAADAMMTIKLANALVPEVVRDQLHEWFDGKLPPKPKPKTKPECSPPSQVDLHTWLAWEAFRETEGKRKHGVVMSKEQRIEWVLKEHPESREWLDSGVTKKRLLGFIGYSSRPYRGTRDWLAYWSTTGESSADAARRLITSPPPVPGPIE